jgi:hypothetical protein
MPGSESAAPTPSALAVRTVFDCFKDGSFDFGLYRAYQERKRQRSDNEDEELLMLALALEEEENDYYFGNYDDNQRTRNGRSCKRRAQLFVLGPNNERIPLTPKVSPWYVSYVLYPQTDNEQFRQIFRRRFRLPHEQFIELVEKCRAYPEMEQWHQQKRDAAGDEASPIELLVLGSLRYLGRGWTFDDLEEATAIGKETHRQFFHAFITMGSTVLFDQYVVAPSTPEDAYCHEYHIAGFPGCIGSMDASHIMCEKVPFFLRQAHLGYKLHGTARTYNLVVNHRRMILRYALKFMILGERFIRLTARLFMIPVPPKAIQVVGMIKHWYGMIALL